MTLNTPEKELISSLQKQKLCLKCLACCKILAIPTDRFLISEDDIELYEARGCRLTMLGGKFYIVMPYHCPHLTLQGCRIYDKRPKACRDYDGREDPLVEDVCLWREENREKSVFSLCAEKINQLLIKLLTLWVKDECLWREENREKIK